MSNEAFKAITLDRILARRNLWEAMKKVQANKGSPGVDGMKTEELKEYFFENPGKLTAMIRQGEYRPLPIKRVYIPKDNGEQRPLGIPTVIDRFVQQAVALVLSEEYEKLFKDMSFGFRPNRSCRLAVRRAMEHVKDGYMWVVDLDLRKFFDTVNHSKLIQLLSDRIEDGRVVSLIHKFLRAPICEEGKVGKPNTIGTPQGGVISPLLANILLHELDEKLESKGVRAVRYADDAVLFAKSRKAAERLLEWVTDFIEQKLFLKVNAEKTKILRIGDPEVQFLGFSFTSQVSKKRRERYPTYRYFPVVHRKKMLKLKEKLLTYKINSKLADKTNCGFKKRFLYFFISIFAGSLTKNIKKRADLYKKTGKSSEIIVVGAKDKEKGIPVRWFKGSKTLWFEGIQVKCPACYDEYLTKIYGDYNSYDPSKKYKYSSDLVEISADVYSTTQSYKDLI